MLNVPAVAFGHFCGSLADQLQGRLAMIVVQMQPSFLCTAGNESALRQTEARAWWVERIAALAERGVRHIYVVANNHYEGHAPATLRTLIAELTERGIAVAPASGWPNGQVPLF